MVIQPTQQGQGMYMWNLLDLWVQGKIKWETVRYAAKSRPIAVAGKGGSYQVDPSFDVG